jgi:dihydrofolate reductase
MDTSMIISIIVAVAENGIIGCGDNIPWYLRSDLKRFAKITRGHTVIAGRKTHESILKRLGHSLSNRKTIIITQQSNYPVPDGCEIALSWDNAMKIARSEQEIFVIGGAEIYRLAIPYAKRMYLTKVHTKCTGDVFFPAYSATEWQEVFSEPHNRDENNDCDFTFIILERKTSTFVNLENMRLIKEQTEIMKTIQEEGFCPFCPEHYEKSGLMPILKEGKYWHIRQNRWPYENTRIHLIVIHNAHAEKISDLAPEAAQELFELAKWFETEYKVSGGGIGIRFGDPRVNGATVNHLHAHFITADITDKKNPQYKPVRVRVG